MSIIINAIRQAHRELALALISQAQPYQLCQYDHHGQTAIHLAVQKNYIDIVKRLLEKGADINALATDPSYSHMTPLHYAALTGNVKAVQLLLSWGANIYLENGQFHTAATIAYQHGFLEIARIIEQRPQQLVKYQWPQYLPLQNATGTLAELQPKSNVLDFVAYRQKKQMKP
jgi:ankyrin repeat protein